MLRKLLLLELALFVSIVLAEVALRLVDMPTNKWWVWQPNLRQTFQPECSIFPGVNGASTFTINPIGYRGDLFVPWRQHYRMSLFGRWRNMDKFVTARAE